MAAGENTWLCADTTILGEDPYLYLTQTLGKQVVEQPNTIFKSLDETKCLLKLKLGEDVDELMLPAGLWVIDRDTLYQGLNKADWFPDWLINSDTIFI